MTFSSNYNMLTSLLKMKQKTTTCLLYIETMDTFEYSLRKEINHLTLPTIGSRSINSKKRVESGQPT